MAENQNVETIRSLFEMLDRRELDKLAQYVTPEMVRHDLVGAYPGVTSETVVDFLNMVISAVPDMKLNIEDIFGEGDRVAVRFKLEGTHEGEIFGHQGSGKRVSVNCINIYRLADGKVAETWQLQDVAGFAQQVGAAE